MYYPSWVTLPFLGSFPQDYSFDLYPVEILYSCDAGSSVILINGSLPPGLSYTVTNQKLFLIGGISVNHTDLESYQFTFRIKQANNTVADRTFSLSIVPLPVVPSWANQPQFLGYQNNTDTYTYQLAASVPDGYTIDYSLLTPILGMEIDPYYGILTFSASSFLINSSVNFNVRAATSNVYSDIDLTIDVIIAPLQPRWITPSGDIGSYIGDSFVEFNFNAEDTSGAEVSYSLITAPVGFPFNLSSTGLFYGQAPNIVDNITYTFVVRATSINGTQDRTFSITIELFSATSLIQWETGPNLGFIYDGQFITIDIIATTDRGTSVHYAVTGGMLPPHLMLDNSSGKIIGFCEYHAISKSYTFEITANDGYQEITQQFNLQVEKQYYDEFMGAYLPVTGNLRERMVSDVNALEIRKPGTAIYYKIQDVVTHPILQIINGININYGQPDAIVQDILPWIHQLDLQIGPSGNSLIYDSNELSVIYRKVDDSQNKANATVNISNVAVTNTVWPISINNLRYALSLDNSFVSNGGGYGFEGVPVIDWNTGGLAQVIVTNPGSNYKGKPQLIISGSGYDASVDSILGLVNVDIVDIGSNWIVGDEIVFPSVGAITPAVIKITQVTANGGIVDLEITDPGNYIQTSAASNFVIQKNAAQAKISPVWGIIDVKVVSPGYGYECGIQLTSIGTEILPFYQDNYAPVIKQGKIENSVASYTADYLNSDPETLWGTIWKPNYIVLEWQGVRWLGATTFDSEITTFDGDATRFQEAEDPRDTVFDNNLTVFEHDNTIFDFIDPLSYNIFQVWGGTLIDFGTTVFDLYTTIFDALTPSTNSITLVRKLIHMQNRIYSGNNVVW